MSTTTPNRPDPMSRVYRTRWFMPAFALFLGVLIFAAYWIGDKPGVGASAFGVMAVLAAIFLVRRAPLRDDRRARRPRLRRALGAH